MLKSTSMCNAESDLNPISPRLTKMWAHLFFLSQNKQVSLSNVDKVESSDYLQYDVRDARPCRAYRVQQQVNF